MASPMTLIPGPSLSTTLPATTSAAAHINQNARQASTTTRMNLGPLTDTTWTPPAQCQSIYPNCETCNIAWAAQTCYTSGIVSDAQACWPSRASSVSSTDGALLGWGFYSPGIVCPQGYTSAIAVTGGGPGFGFQFPISSGETAVGCCPTYAVQGGHFIPDGSGAQTCKLVVTSGGQIDLATCDGPASIPHSTHAIPITAATTTLTDYSIYGPLIQIVWRSSDISPGGVAPDGNGGTTTTTSVGSGNSTSAGSGNGGGGDGSELSTGAKVAIGVLAGLLAVAVLIGLFWWWRRRHRGAAKRGVSELPGGGTVQNPQDGIPSSTPNKGGFMKSVFGGGHSREEARVYPRNQDIAEVGNTELTELDGDHGRLEMMGTGGYHYHQGGPEQQFYPKQYTGSTELDGGGHYNGYNNGYGSWSGTPEYQAVAPAQGDHYNWGTR